MVLICSRCSQPSWWCCPYCPLFEVVLMSSWRSMSSSSSARKFLVYQYFSFLAFCLKEYSAVIGTCWYFSTTFPTTSFTLFIFQRISVLVTWSLYDTLSILLYSHNSKGSSCLLLALDSVQASTP